jgi:hypothetical protein
VVVGNRQRAASWSIFPRRRGERGVHGAVLGAQPTVEDVVARFDEIRGAGAVRNEVDGEALVLGLQSLAPRLSPLQR